MSVSHVFRPDRFHHFHAFTFDTTFPSSPSKCLDSFVSSIPLAPVLGNDKVSVVTTSADSQVTSVESTVGELDDNAVDISDSGNTQIAAAIDDNLSPSFSVGCSLKRMLSRNRPEPKVFPSTNANELEV
ncbi:hypothetical protein PTKIN_Ptkin03bG0009400 [Pterospermum kingtungense]